MIWKLRCTDIDTGTDTIGRYEQVLKNYNMIQQIGHRYEIDTIRV